MPAQSGSCAATMAGSTDALGLALASKLRAQDRRAAYSISGMQLAS
jgi:hypothetical protein